MLVSKECSAKSSHGLRVKVRGVLFSRNMSATSIPAMSSHWERTYMKAGYDGFQSAEVGTLVNYAPCSWKAARLISYGSPTLRRGVLNGFNWGQINYSGAI